MCAADGRFNDFRGDPYGYVCNQAGHAAIVGFGLALLALTILPALWVPPLVALAYGVIWERMIQRGNLWADSLEDTAHVMVGSAAPATAVFYATDFWACWLTLAVCFGGWAAVLAVGIVRRRMREWQEWGL